MKISNTSIVLFLVILVQLSACKSKKDKVSESDKLAKNTRVIGYLPTHRVNESSQIDYCKLTHLNLAFANPDASGNLIVEPIDGIVNNARTVNPAIKISISLAGAVSDPQIIKNWSDRIDIAANRPAFVTKIVDYVLANNLDGVDVDLEWDLVTKGYSPFVIELKKALAPYNKILTAALPNNTRFANISDVALKVFDFINIMAYDSTGPWNPNKPGQHSSYEYSNSGICFWKDSVKIPKEKLCLGLPFYGYDFSKTPVTSVTYQSLVDSNAALADSDKQGDIYYNGRPTIDAKVELALKEVGGIMIWELGQDSFDQYSLLLTIHNKLTSLNVNVASRSKTN